jgi:hypothetical protein
MTPKEKAKELFYKMFADWLQIPYEAVEYHVAIPGFSIVPEWHSAKKCALIAADEMIDATAPYITLLSEHIYWQDVKKEIESL